MQDILGRRLPRLAVAVIAAIVIGSSLVGAVRAAESYPSRPIRLVLTYPPGGNSDLVGRTIAQGLTERVRHQVVVDNRGGGGGVIGTQTTINANPDGYTIMLGTSAGMILQPLLMKKPPYDPQKDLAPVSLVVTAAQVLVTYPGLPAKTVGELLALARAKPGTLNGASSGTGTPNHLGIEMLKGLAGIDVVHIPYKGGAAALMDVMTGKAHLAFSSIFSVMQYVRAGKLHAMGIGSAKRNPTVPDIPTIAETVPGYEYTVWLGIFAPAATPRPIVARLNTEIGMAVASATVHQRLAGLGGEPQSSTPEWLRDYVREETQRWAKVIRLANVRIEG